MFLGKFQVKTKKVHTPVRTKPKTASGCLGGIGRRGNKLKERSASIWRFAPLFSRFPSTALLFGHNSGSELPLTDHARAEQPTQNPLVDRSDLHYGRRA